MLSQSLAVCVHDEINAAENSKNFKMSEELIDDEQSFPWRCSRRKRKRQQKHIAKYRTIGFLILIGGAFVINKSQSNESTIRKLMDINRHRSDIEGSVLDRIQTFSKVDSGIDESPCNGKNRVTNKSFLFLYGAGVIYMFFAIAIVCDEFFVPALEEIASENYFDLSMDVAGATLMAAGGSAPELFTSLIGTFQGSEVGFGTIVGSAVFNVLFVIGMCAMFSKDVLTLTWWPLARDCAYYAVGLSMLAIFCGVVSPGRIEAWEALVLFGLYVGYVILMKFNETLYSKIQRSLEKSKVADEGNNSIQRKYSIGSGQVHTYRAGLLNMYMGKGSLLDRVGIAMVTRISGDVGTVFKALDTSGLGFLDISDFRDLVESLGTKVNDDEIVQAIDDLDDNRDGKVSRCM
jgi:sodium/potassium/calcium exchanger 2